MSQTDTKNDERLIRKLGSAELVYDHELKNKGCVLPFSMLVESDYDLFADLPLLDRAVRAWKSLHPFLQSKIVTKEDPKHAISNIRFFAYASQAKIDSFDNVDYIRIESNETITDYDSLWKILHEREFNIDPVDSKNGLLWRLKIVELQTDHQKMLFSYLFTFTVHHAIIDGRNAFAVMDKLVDLVEKHMLGTFNPDTDIPKFKVSPSIEEKLFNFNEEEMKNIKLNKEFEIPPNNKIPASFAQDPKDNKPRETSSQIRFLHLNSNKKDLLLKDLIAERANNGYETNFVSFCIDEIKINRLLSNCKKVGAKLTGCLNLICSLATLQTYKMFDKDINNNSDESLSKIIYFHFLANLRPFFNIDNLNMGYWAIVLNGVIKTDKINMDDAEFWRRDFWNLAKHESDQIHERIKQNELIENAKLDEFLVDDINNNVSYEHGAVHFALSNLGMMKSASKLVRCRELYYNTGCVANRWTAIVFHGLSSVNNRLCWGIAHNRKLVRDEVVEYLMENIKEIIAKLSE